MTDVKLYTAADAATQAALDKAHAAIPLRTLAEVTADISTAERKNRTGRTLARLIANHGRCTDEARAYARQYAGME